MSARRRRGEQVIHEDNEEYRRDDRVLGYNSLNSVQIAKNKEQLIVNEQLEKL